jgi:hypothetical protein
MAVRYAVFNNSIWSSGATWDNGSVPLSGDSVYMNGFTMTLDQDITVDTIRSSVPPVYLPNMSIPAMTSNSTPYGNVIASTDATNAWKVFDQDGSTTWGPTANIVGWIGYQFTAATIIKRFYYVGNSIGYNSSTFQGSLNNITWDTIHIIPNGSGSYLSPVLTSTTAYSYYRLNIGSVQFGQGMGLNRLEMTESTGTTYGSTAGGSLSVLNSKNITVTNNQGLVSGSATYLININTNSPNIVNINSTGTYMTSIPIGESTVSYITIAGSGNVNVTGNIYRVQKSINATTATGIINYSGTSIGGFQGSSPTHNLVFAGNATFNVYGFLRGDDTTGGAAGNGTALSYAGSNVCNIYSQLISNAGVPVILSHSGVVNISGNTTAFNIREGINSSGSGTININGNLIAGTNAPAITSSGTAPINILSGITLSASSNSPVIVSSSTGLVTASSPFINTNNVPAVLAQKFRFYSGQTAQWRFQDTTNSNITLTSINSSGVTIGLPLSGDVRYLTTYGQNNEYVGSLRVPSVDNVRKGVQTDFTVGTADLTANDIFSAITTSSNSVAVRLRNVSTVQSAGDQIASLS